MPSTINQTKIQIEEQSSSVCLIDPKYFCVICANYIKKSLKLISFTKTLRIKYQQLFQRDPPTPQWWIPDSVCYSCQFGLKFGYSKKSFTISSPVIWRKPSTHELDCWFCMTKVPSFNNRNGIVKYPKISSVTPALHQQNLEKPVLEISSSNKYSQLAVSSLDKSENGSNVSSNVDFSFRPNQKNKRPTIVKQLNQAQFNDFMRHGCFTKNMSKFITEVFKEQGFIESNVKTSQFYRKREKDLFVFFTNELDLCYCNDIRGLMTFFQIRYDPSNWRLFIDSSKNSLKGVLLHNGNELPSIPIAYSTTLKESFESVNLIIHKIHYGDHNWKICGDLKIIRFLLGQQQGNTKMPCFLCEWCHSDKWKKIQYDRRTSFRIGSKNIVAQKLVDPRDVLLPPLHIKLGLMTQFAINLKTDGKAVKFLKNKFRYLSQAKIDAGIFNGPEIRALMNDGDFEKTLLKKEKAAWNSFKQVVENF